MKIFNTYLKMTNEICMNQKAKIKDLFYTILITNIILKCNNFLFILYYTKYIQLIMAYEIYINLKQKIKDY